MLYSFYSNGIPFQQKSSHKYIDWLLEYSKLINEKSYFNESSNMTFIQKLHIRIHWRCDCVASNEDFSVFQTAYMHYVKFRWPWIVLPASNLEAICRCSLLCPFFAYSHSVVTKWDMFVDEEIAMVPGMVHETLPLEVSSGIASCAICSCVPRECSTCLVIKSKIVWYYAFWAR